MELEGDKNSVFLDSVEGINVFLQEVIDNATKTLEKIENKEKISDHEIWELNCALMLYKIFKNRKKND